MNIAIFGASGKTGKILVQMCLANGHSVTAFTHRSNPFQNNPNLTVMNGDVHNYPDVAAAIAGNQIVLSALGSWGTKSKDIVSSGTENIIKAMQYESIKRVITLTGSDAIRPGQNLSLIQKLVRAGITIANAKILHDGERHIKLLAESDLDWTVIRSPIMTNSNTTDYKLANDAPALPSLISRKAVAQAMYDQIGRTEQLKQAPIVLPQ